MLKRFTVLILTITIVICDCQKAISSSSSQNQFFKLGAILHLTGDQAEPAQAFLQGIELAVDEINQGGGILDQTVQLAVEDDQLNSEKAHTAAIKLVTTDQVRSVILASFLEAMATGPYLEQNKIPAITLWDSAQEIEQLGEYIFGIGIWTPSAGEVAAEFAFDRLKLKKISIVNIQNEWSQAVSGFFRNKFESLGGQIVSTYTLLPSDTQDFRAVILKIKQDQVDGIYSPITDGVTTFYKQISEFNVSQPIITSDIMTENHIQVLAQAAEGIYQTQAASPDNPQTEHLRQLFRIKFQQDPNQTLFLAWGYDAVQLIKKAAELGGSFEPASIKDNLYQIQNFFGASGEISIDRNGSSRTLEKMYQLQAGRFVLVD